MINYLWKVHTNIPFSGGRYVVSKERSPEEVMEIAKNTFLKGDNGQKRWISNIEFVDEVYVNRGNL